MYWCTWYVVDSTVDDHSSLLHPLPSHHLCSARPHHQDISPGHLQADRKRIIRQKGNTGNSGFQDSYSSDLIYILSNKYNNNNCQYSGE